MSERKSRRFLSADSSIKDDLQDIFASAEDSYDYIKNVSYILKEVEERIANLDRVIKEYTNSAEDDQDTNEEKLVEIVEFCASISDSFEKLTELLASSSDDQMEETKKNRVVLMNLANSYKKINDSITEIIESLERARASRQSLEKAMLDATAKITFIYDTIHSQATIMSFFKNILADRLPLILPKLELMADEILQDKGYDSNGKKKDTVLNLLNMVWVQIKNNMVQLVATSLVVAFMRNYRQQQDANAKAQQPAPVVQTISQEDLDKLNKELADQKELNRLLIERAKKNGKRVEPNP